MLIYPIIQDYTVLYNTQNIYSSLSCIHFVTFNFYSDVHVHESSTYFHPTVSLWLSVCLLSLPVSFYLSFCLCFCLSLSSYHILILYIPLSLVVITLLSVRVDSLPPVSLVTEENQLKLEKEEDSKQMYHIKKWNWLLGTIIYTNIRLG